MFALLYLCYYNNRSYLARTHGVLAQGGEPGLVHERLTQDALQTPWAYGVLHSTQGQPGVPADSGQAALPEHVGEAIVQIPRQQGMTAAQLGQGVTPIVGTDVHGPIVDTMRGAAHLNQPPPSVSSKGVLIEVQTAPTMQQGTSRAQRGPNGAHVGSFEISQWNSGMFGRILENVRNECSSPKNEGNRDIHGENGGTVGNNPEFAGNELNSKLVVGNTGKNGEHPGPVLSAEILAERGSAGSLAWYSSEKLIHPFQET